MKKAAKAVLVLAVLAAALAGAARGQGTTYIMPASSTFVCDAASRYPVTSFYQFECRGIRLADSSGKVVGSFFLFRVSEIGISLPGIVYDPYDSYVTKLDSFTEPNGNTPGTFQFEWQADNGAHTGTASGTWVDFVICGGRGCQWHAPKLLTFQTTVN